MSAKIRQLELGSAAAAKGVLRLYKEAGWATHDDPSSVAKALANSYCAFGAFDGKKMVGFFRAFSDGVADAYLLDLIVNEDYRRAGIASALTRAIVGKLKADGIEWITAISTPMAKPMYLKIGKRMAAHAPVRF